MPNRLSPGRAGALCAGLCLSHWIPQCLLATWLSLSLAACATRGPFVVHPVLPAQSSACPLGEVSVVAIEVEDRRGVSAAANVGFTQTGLSNRRTPLETDPNAVALVERVVRDSLPCRASAASAPTARVHVLLERFYTGEETGFVREEIRTEIAVEVRLVDTRTGRQQVVRASGSAEHRSGADQTQFAGPVIEAALAGLHRDLASKLSALPRTQSVRVAPHIVAPQRSVPIEAAPGDMPTPGSELVAPVAVPGSELAAPASVPSASTARTIAPPLRAQASLLAASDTAKLFRNQAAAQRFVGVRLTLQRVTDLGADDSVRVLRYRTRALTVAGSALTAIDPEKLAEYGRVNVTGHALAFGVVGASAAAAADRQARDRADAVSWSEVVLTPEAPSASVVVFFEVAGASRVALSGIEIEVESTLSGELTPIRASWATQSIEPSRSSKRRDAQPPNARSRPSKRRQRALWLTGGTAVLGLQLIAYSTLQYVGSDRDDTTFKAMRPINDAGWVLFGVGATAHLLTWTLPAATDRKPSAHHGELNLGVSPTGFSARGSF